MASDAFAEECTYEGRLASFKKTIPGQKARRGSAASGRGGAKANAATSWPHAKYLPAEQMARAGFAWRPGPENPDNATCFLCDKSLDGWEQGDDPLEEHLRHSSNCGWAIVAAIEAGYDDFVGEDPGSASMIQARKATFAGRWPHEGKRGWKCKSKQLAEAGWKWTPTLEYEDMATCTYCELALDGWEQGDKPMDEHRNRSPDCPFFVLMAQYDGIRKARGKGARGSKVSRASTQSVMTTTTEAPSILEDGLAEHDDSIMTTTSTAGAKKGRGKRATTTTAKGRKTKAKKEEPAEDIEDEPATSMAEQQQQTASEPVPKTTRGRKRGSHAMDESVLADIEAPASKRRATKTRSSNSRKASGSSTRANGSTASVRTAPGAFPDEDEEEEEEVEEQEEDIDRQLEADLERPLSDEEGDDIMHDDANSERRDAAPPKSSAVEETSRLWDAIHPQTDNAEVEKDLQRLQEQIAAEEEAAASSTRARQHDQSESESLDVPKKGRKTGGTRKASKQTKTQKVKEAEAAAAAAAAAAAEEAARQEWEQQHKEEEREAEDEDEENDAVEGAESEDEIALVAEPEAQASKAEAVATEEDLDASTATVVTHTSKSRTSTGRKRGRPSKAEVAARLSAQQAMEEENETHAPEAPAEPVTVTEVDGAKEEEEKQEQEEQEEPQDKEVPETRVVEESSPVRHRAEAVAQSSPVQSSPAPPPSSVPRRLQQPPATPGSHRASPVQSARQPAVSPSPSPQPSDAENQPPSARPAGATQKRVALAPLAATPARAPNSPSKRSNVVAGLKSTKPWTAVDVEMVLGSPEKQGRGDEQDKEDVASAAAAAMDGVLSRGSELTSPEKRMTVEEWIYFNAERAEGKLKMECEGMVSRFESEGTRAMMALEGLVVE